MRVEKAKLEKSVNGALKKAEDCFELAKTQYAAANTQHNIIMHCKS